MLAELIGPTPRDMGDRSETVGASEIGLCARRTWFTKRDTPAEIEETWGFAERGHVIEAWVISRLWHTEIEYMQRRYVRGWLSATVDLIYKGEPVDIKSADPRISRLPKPAHVMQSQVQSALVGSTRGHLLYIDASDFSKITEIPVPAVDISPLEERARAIMTGPMPVPEGRIAGGDECRWCPFQVTCLGAPIEDKGHLTDEDTQLLESARQIIKGLEVEADNISHDINRHKEIIRDILRAADVRRAPGLARIARSQRSTVDHEAMAADGIDVGRYRKLGKPSESVTLE